MNQGTSMSIQKFTEVWKILRYDQLSLGYGRSHMTQPKKLFSLIIPYLPRKFSIKSTHNFVGLPRECQRPNTITSLDVTDIFTNLTINGTIEIIVCNVYYHPQLPPLEFFFDCLREYLVIGTTRTPFRIINEDIYIQKERVSMGSRLGPTFAEVYMCDLENKFSRTNWTSRPSSMHDMLINLLQ